MEKYPYHREKACDYGIQWAQKRNPAYLDFGPLGGDCTNFVSQCLYAGSGTMDETKTFGWYYHTASDRASAWSGVPYLARYLLRSSPTPGPYGVLATRRQAEAGDIIFLSDGNRLYHSLLVLENSKGDITVAAHDDNALYRPLATYFPYDIVFVHILGVHCLWK